MPFMCTTVINAVCIYLTVHVTGIKCAAERSICGSGFVFVDGLGRKLNETVLTK